jgi:transposase
MPWRIETHMSQRLEFVVLAAQGGLAFREVCRRFGISCKTGYKWVKRYKEAGPLALNDRSRKPVRSPTRVAAAVAEKVIALRRETTWCGRKLRQRLEAMGEKDVPAASTCTEILRRADLLKKDRPIGALQRFERSLPNQLWQMDHKGDFPTQSGQRCHALTMLDDHSRFNLVLDAADNERGASVQATLAVAFARTGCRRRSSVIMAQRGAAWGMAPATLRSRCGFCD